MSRTIVVSGYGTFVGKRSERLLLRNAAAARKPKGDGEAAPAPPLEEEIPLFRVGEILVPPRGVTISSDLVEEAVSRGIPITFLSSNGQPYAMLTSPMLTATTQTRRAQLRALENEKGAQLVKKLVGAKLRNQASLLVYFAKAERDEPTRRARVLEAAEEVRKARKLALAVEGSRPDDVRERVLGHEGLGARAYWNGVRALLEGRCEFEGRKGRGAVDPVNALLNYGYGILSSRVWAAVMLAGLDPFAGFLHTDRPGKPSLVLDLMEEMRAPVVDRAVFAHVRLGEPVRFDGKLLHQDTRRRLADAVIERLEAKVTVRGKRLQLGSVLQRQARSVAMFLRGEGEFRPFSMTW